MFLIIKNEKLRQKITILFVLIISIYALFLRSDHLSGHVFSSDENWQVAYAEQATSIVDFIKILPKIEFCSYISGDYILTYPFVKLFGRNKWGLAIPHIISTILGFYLLYLVCRLYLKTIWGYVITFIIVCFNATLLKHAFELRTYAVLPTLALGVFYISHFLVERPEVNTIKKWLIGIFFVLVIWFHVYGIVIVLLPVAFSLLSKLRDKSFKAVFKVNIKLLTIVLCIAMPLWFYSVFGPHINRDFNSPDNYLYPFIFIANPFVDPISFLKSIFGNLMGYKKLYPLLLGIIFPFILPYKDRYKQIGFLCITVFIPIQLILLSDSTTGYWFIQKQFIWVMPFFAFFIGWVWESFFLYVFRKLDFHKD